MSRNRQEGKEIAAGPAGSESGQVVIKASRLALGSAVISPCRMERGPVLAQDDVLDPAKVLPKPPVARRQADSSPLCRARPGVWTFCHEVWKVLVRLE